MWISLPLRIGVSFRLSPYSLEDKHAQLKLDYPVRIASFRLRQERTWVVLHVSGDTLNRGVTGSISIILPLTVVVPWVWPALKAPVAQILVIACSAKKTSTNSWGIVLIEDLHKLRRLKEWGREPGEPRDGIMWDRQFCVLEMNLFTPAFHVCLKISPKERLTEQTRASYGHLSDSQRCLSPVAPVCCLGKLFYVSHSERRSRSGACFL